MLVIMECDRYPSEGHHVERVFSAVDGVHEVAVGELRTRKHLQLTADRNEFVQNIPSRPKVTFTSLSIDHTANVENRETEKQRNQRTSGFST